jgi:hypothetical protein
VVKQGCLAHDMTDEQVESWWKVATERAAHVSMCACCLAPCPIDSPVCKRCASADIDALRKSWTPRP